MPAHTAHTACAHTPSTRAQPHEALGEGEAAGAPPHSGRWAAGQSFGSKTPPDSEGLRSPELGLGGLGEGPPLAWLPRSGSGEGSGSLGLRGRLSRAAARSLGPPLGAAGLLHTPRRLPCPPRAPRVPRWTQPRDEVAFTARCTRSGPGRPWRAAALAGAPPASLPTSADVKASVRGLTPGSRKPCRQGPQRGRAGRGTGAEFPGEGQVGGAGGTPRPPFRVTAGPCELPPPSVTPGVLTPARCLCRRWLVANRRACVLPTCVPRWRWPRGHPRPLG